MAHSSGSGGDKSWNSWYGSWQDKGQENARKKNTPSGGAKGDRTAKLVASLKRVTEELAAARGAEVG